MGVAEKAKSAVAKNDPAGKKESLVPKTLAGMNSVGIEKLFDAYKLRLMQLLPVHITPERVFQMMVTVVARNQDIKKCTTTSIIGSMMNAAMLGLDVTPQFGHCYFVPYYNGELKSYECQFQIGYKGIIHLAQNSDKIETIYAEVVREGDAFEVELGLNSDLKHKPLLSGNKPGELIASYLVVHFKGGGHYFKVLSKWEVESRRDRSQAVKAAKKFKFKTPWDTDEAAMWCKSAVHAAKPYLPLQANLQKALATDGAVVDMDKSWDTKAKDVDLSKIDLSGAEDIESTSEEKKESSAEAFEGQADFIISASRMIEELPQSLVDGIFAEMEIKALMDIKSKDRADFLLSRLSGELDSADVKKEDKKSATKQGTLL